jgi:ComEC/Rec2-related protein
MLFPELRSRLPLLPLAGAAALGIALADPVPVSPWVPLALTALLLAALLFRPRTWLAWLFTVAGFFSLHTLTYHGSEGRLLERALGPGPMVAEATGIVWSEPEKPRVWSRTVTGHFLMRLEHLQMGGVARESSALVQVRWAGAELPQYGDRVSLLGSLGDLAPIRNSGQFDSVTYRHRQGIYEELTARYPVDCTILSHGHGAPLQAAAFAARHWICGVLENDLQDSPEITSLIESMVLGVRGETPDDTRDLFQRTGTMHLFAVSGFNVMLLAALAWRLLKVLRIRRAAAVLVIVPLLFAYALVVGTGASCLRAAITCSVFLAGYLLDRPPPAINSVAAAACVILAWDTSQLFSTGFQFTFVLVLLLILLSGRVERRVARWGRLDPYLPPSLWNRPQRVYSRGWQGLAGMVSVCFVGWLGSLIFTVGYFHLFAPAALVANLVAVPISLFIFYFGTGSLVAAAFSSALSGLFNNASWCCAHALLRVLAFSAWLPGSYFYLHPSLAARPECEFTVLDLGFASAIHLRAAGADWLIDCGHGYAYEQIVVPYLRSQGVTSLEGFVLTHGDAPHMGSAPALLADLHPRLVLDSPVKDRSRSRRDFHAVLVAADAPKRLVWRGDAFDLAPGVRLSVLYPPPGLQRSLADDKALVLRLEAAGTRALFVSDAGYATEQWLLQNEPDLRADVLVKGQHAKDLSGSADLLHAVQPELIVSAPPRLGANPDERDQWVRAVEAQGIVLFSQEQTGAVHVALAPSAFEATAWLGGYTFRSRAR